MSHQRGFYLLLIISLLLAGCAAAPSAKVHYTIKQDPGSRPLQQVVLLPVDVDVYELSAGGVKEEVPEWSSTAETNVRNALLVSKEAGGKCCVTRPVDTSSLTPDERAILGVHFWPCSTQLRPMQCGRPCHSIQPGTSRLSTSITPWAMAWAS